MPDRTSSVVDVAPNVFAICLSSACPDKRNRAASAAWARAYGLM